MKYVTIIALFLLSACLDYTLEVVDRVQDEIGGPKGSIKVVGDNVMKAEEIARWSYAAAGGDPEAQYRMGKAHCCGPRPYYNTYDALKWFCLAAKQGQRDAMEEVGKIYQNAHKEDGSYIPRDKLLAYVYFAKAVEHGNDDAKEWLGKVKQAMSDSEIKQARKLMSEWPDVQCEIH